MKRSGAFTAIRLDKTSQPVHHASSTSFVQACCNALNRAITIFLLVRQQLERIDQVVTQPQRRCVRCEDLRFTGTDTELHHQYLFGRSPFVLASTSRTHQLQCFLFLLVPSPCPVDTHQM